MSVILRERAVGERFEYKTSRYEVQENLDARDQRDCDDCAFCDKQDRASCTMTEEQDQWFGKCCDRSDDKWVIFKKI